MYRLVVRAHKILHIKDDKGRGASIEFLSSHLGHLLQRREQDEISSRWDAQLGRHPIDALRRPTDRWMAMSGTLAYISSLSQKQ